MPVKSKTEKKPKTEEKKPNKSRDAEVSVDLLHPNEWNPNRMDDHTLSQLTKAVRITLKQTGTIPRVVVRVCDQKKERKCPAHLKGKEHYSIIDGFHRWTVLRLKLKRPTCPVAIIDADDAMAKRLTISLNYLRGKADPDDYTKLLRDLSEAVDIEEILPFVTESKKDIESILGATSFDELPSDFLDLLDPSDPAAKASGRQLKPKKTKGDGATSMLLRMTVTEMSIIDEALCLAQADEGKEGEVISRICKEWMDRHQS